MNLRQLAKTTAGIAVLVVVTSGIVSAQEKKREYITAIAQGTSTQLGRMVSVNLIVNELSTADDQKVLIAAFQEKGSEGLANTLHKMHSKGRIAITGTLGFDVNYIREFPMPDGSRKIRFVTDRPITFGEAWTASRSSDYSLSMGELIIAADKDKSSGTILPVAKFKLDKEKELTMEAFQNPWKLLNIKVSH